MVLLFGAAAQAAAEAAAVLQVQPLVMGPREREIEIDRNDELPGRYEILMDCQTDDPWTDTVVERLGPTTGHRDA